MNQYLETLIFSCLKASFFQFFLESCNPMVVLAIVCVAPAHPAATMQWARLLGHVGAHNEFFPGVSPKQHLMRACAHVRSDARVAAAPQAEVVTVNAMLASLSPLLHKPSAQLRPWAAYALGGPCPQSGRLEMNPRSKLSMPTVVPCGMGLSSSMRN